MKPNRPIHEVDLVAETLRKSQPISNRSYQNTITFLPILIVLLLLADWLIGTSAFAGDLFRLTGVLLNVIEFIILGKLFRDLPEALKSIWTRDLLSNRKEHQEDFIGYINAFRATLNSRWSWGMGTLCAVVELGGTYPVTWFLATGHWPPAPAGVTCGGDACYLLWYYLWGRAAFVAAPIGYLLGLGLWRVGVIATYISKLGRGFELKLQPNHPDRCGGLRPIGNLCLMLALMLLAVAIYLAMWSLGTVLGTAILGASSDVFSQMQSSHQLWTGLFRLGLVIVSALALFVFLWPLYSIHLQMQKQRQEIQAELDALAQRINEISIELRTQVQKLTPEQGEEKLKSLELMEKVFEENSRVPAWPLDWQMVISFSSTQAVPILSLIGTSEPVTALLKNIIGVATGH